MSRILHTFLDNEPAVRRVVARYIFGPENISDLTQEVFLKAFAAEMTTEIHDPKAFIFRIAKNLALSEIKKKVNSTTDYLEDSGGTDVVIDSSQVTLDERIDGERKLYVFARAVALLPLECRRPFLMRKMENLKFKQIATRLNVSVSTIEKRVAKALVLCNSYLRQQGYNPEEFGAAPIATKRRQVEAMVYPVSAPLVQSDQDDD